MMFLIQTKTNVPSLRTDRLHRTRLLGPLDSGADCTLTLLTAPAGFGKTTLLVDWIKRTTRDVAWLSLDRQDADPFRFLAYLISALQTVDECIGQSILEALHSAQPLDVASCLPQLIHDIEQTQKSCILILDDYHVVDCAPINELIERFLWNLPRHVQLVIATREEPRLSLARLRVQAELIELRAEELRFTSEETSAFLTSTLGEALSKQDIQTLLQRTEGWITGLQLAALSIQKHEDISERIQSFTGHHRFVLDYLMDEVLREQPESRRLFLLETSILERLNASLCNAITLRVDAQNTLDMLEKSHLFLVALDSSRLWFRYHHLFADALQNTLQRSMPEYVQELHLRAYRWHIEYDLPFDALRHAIAAEAFEQAADLLEALWPEMSATYQTATWMTWLKRLPEQLVSSRPLLASGYGWSMLYQGDLEKAEPQFQKAEDALRQFECTASQVNQELLDELPASLSTSKAYRALMLGHMDDAVHYAQQAVGQVTAQHHLIYTQSVAIVGIGYWAKGALDEAEQTLAQLVTHLYEKGKLVDGIELASLNADIHIAKGELYDAFRIYKDACQRVKKRGQSILMGIEDSYRGLADVYREWGQLKQAQEHLHTAECYGEQLIARPNWMHRLCVSRTLLALSEGQFEQALKYVERAIECYDPIPLPVLQPAEALRARVWIVQGDLDKAEEWTRKQRLSIVSKCSYTDEYSYITLIRLWLAMYQKEQKEALLHKTLCFAEQIKQSARQEGRMRNAIELSILQALGHHAKQDLGEALVYLEQALTWAEEHAFIRLFLDEGQAMQTLLQQARRQQIVPRHTERLLEHSTTVSSPSLYMSLLEPLTKREYEVLQMLQTEQTGPEIARTLCVSLSTIRTHTRNIYSKLGVTHRRAALRRAKELHLL